MPVYFIVYIVVSFKLFIYAHTLMWTEKSIFRMLCMIYVYIYYLYKYIGVIIHLHDIKYSNFHILSVIRMLPIICIIITMFNFLKIYIFKFCLLIFIFYCNSIILFYRISFLLIIIIILY